MDLKLLKQGYYQHYNSGDGSMYDHAMAYSWTKKHNTIFYEDNENYYDMFNIPVWKYLDEHGNTLVRGIMPRRNEPFLHIYIGNCIDKINCLEITKQNIDEMD